MTKEILSWFLFVRDMLFSKTKILISYSEKNGKVGIHSRAVSDSMLIRLVPGFFITSFSRMRDNHINCRHEGCEIYSVSTEMIEAVQKIVERRAKEKQEEHGKDIEGK